MSELTDLLIQVGETVGWSFVLLVVFAYQLYWPDKLHPTTGTKLRQLFREPSPAVITSLEAVYERHDDLSRRRLLEILNGDMPRAYQFEVDHEDIKERPGGD